MTAQQVQHIGENLDRSNSAPVAADESRAVDHFWAPDPCDDVLPVTRGFVTDCIYYMRGHECPGLFIEWASLFAIAGAVKREAWLQWGAGRMFSNLYLMIVGPAGAVKKNTAIDFAANLLDYLELEIEDPNLSQMKMIRPFTGTATKEALVTSMKPENQETKEFVLQDKNGAAMLDANGAPITYGASSEITICQHEMCGFTGKSSYMESMIPFLLDVYDAPDHLQILTQARQKEELLDVLVNMIGASAPAAVKESLPGPATADGFLSRCLVVYQSSSEKEFFKPLVPQHAPKMPELRKKLGWIAANTLGEWKFSDEAEAWLVEWYHQFKQQSKLDGLFMGVKSRLDSIMYRVAALFRWQRYERDDKLIHVQDLIDAHALVTRTFQEAIPMYRMLFDKYSNDKSLKTEEFLKRIKHVSRRDLIRNAHVPAEDAYHAVERLREEGLINITLSGRVLDASQRNADEMYHWLESDVDERKLNAKPPTVAIRRK